MADRPIQFCVGTLPNGLVLIDFRAAKVDHLKLTPEQALEMAEGLCEAATDAARGRHIITGTPYLNPDPT